METEMTTKAFKSLVLKERRAGRKKNFPIKLTEMTKTEKLGFALDLETIRKRGMYR